MRRVAPFAHILILIAFIFNCLGPIPSAQADLLVVPSLSKIEYPQNLAAVKGLSIHPDNPLQFDLIVEPNSKNIGQNALRDESLKMIKYFLASITTTEKDMWVNLSPYEKNRIIPDAFGQTLMGRDLLADDYLLKQITASLIHPDTQIGKEFWTKVYAQAQARFGTTNVPINTFNKVWIVPDKATVWEHRNSVFVIERHLRVMLEEDYMSLQKHNVGAITNRPMEQGRLITAPTDTNQIASQIVREIVIPALEHEVNEGASFAQLRQIYNAMILATWYKKKMKDSLLGNIYMDKNKVQGVNISDPQAKEKIYQEYLKTFKKGVFNFIKEEPDPTTGEMVPRKYFSGGMVGLSSAQLVSIEVDDFHLLPNRAQAALPTSAAMKVTFRADLSSNKAMSPSKSSMAMNPDEMARKIFDPDTLMKAIPNPSMKASIDELINPETKNLNLQTLDHVVKEAERLTAEELGFDPKKFRVFIVGGLRYLATGQRKDIDLAFYFDLKDPEPEKALKVFLRYLDDQMRVFKGFGEYRREDNLKNKTYFINLPSNVEHGKATRLLLDTFLPERSPQNQSWGYKFLSHHKTLQEYILELLEFSLTEQLSMESDKPLIEHLRDKIKAYLAAEFYIGRNIVLWKQTRDRYLKAEKDDLDTLKAILNDGEVRQRMVQLTQNIADDHHRQVLLSQIQQRLEEPLGNDTPAMQANKAMISLHIPAFTQILEHVNHVRPDFKVAPEETDLSKAFFSGRKVLNIGPEDVTFRGPKEENVMTFLREKGIEAYSLSPVPKELISFAWKQWHITDYVQDMKHVEDSSFDDVVSIYLFDPSYAISELDYPVIARELHRILRNNGRIYLDWEAAKLLEPELTKMGFEPIEIGNEFMDPKIFINYKNEPESAMHAFTSQNKTVFPTVIDIPETVRAGDQNATPLVYADDAEAMLRALVAVKMIAQGSFNSPRIVGAYESFIGELLINAIGHPEEDGMDILEAMFKQNVTLGISAYKYAERSILRILIHQRYMADSPTKANQSWEVLQENARLSLKELRDRERRKDLRLSKNAGKGLALYSLLSKTRRPLHLEYERDPQGGMTTRLWIQVDKMPDEAMLSPAALDQASTNPAMKTGSGNNAMTSSQRQKVLEAVWENHSSYIRDSKNQKKFMELMRAGQFEEARTLLLSPENSYERYQLVPRQAVYPGGLDFKIFELFPNLDVVHYFNSHPFVVNFATRDLVHSVALHETLRGQEAYLRMKLFYLEAAQYESFINDDLQRSIIYPYADRGFEPQIGVRNFMILDLKRLGYSQIRTRKLRDKVYEISFLDIFGKSRKVIYHQQTLEKSTDMSHLFHEMPTQETNLLFIKAFSGRTISGNSLDIPESLMRLLDQGGVVALDIEGLDLTDLKKHWVNRVRSYHVFPTSIWGNAAEGYDGMRAYVLNPRANAANFATQADGAMFSELTSKDLRYLTSLGVTTSMIESFFDSPDNKTGGRSIGFHGGNQDPNILAKIDQQRFLVEDLLDTIKKKRNEKKIVIYQIGLGEVDPTLEAREIFESVNEAFHQSGLSREEIARWKIAYVGMDYKETIISIAGKYLHSVTSNSIVPWDIHLAQADALVTNDMNSTWGKADYIFHRNVTYANEYASASNLSLYKMPALASRDSEAREAMLNIYLSLRNAIGRLAQKGTRYVTEKATLNRRENVLLIPGAQIITANTYPQNSSSFPEGSVNNRGTGFYEIQDPQAMVNAGLKVFMKLNEVNPAMQAELASAMPSPTPSMDKRSSLFKKVKVINIIVHPINGLGDLHEGLIVARGLKAKDPSLSLRLIVRGGGWIFLKHLVTDFDENEIDQFKEGIQFIDYDKYIETRGKSVDDLKGHVNIYPGYINKKDNPNLNWSHFPRAPLNLFLGEYDNLHKLLGDQIINDFRKMGIYQPVTLDPQGKLIDYEGNRILYMPTGFGEDAQGLYLDAFSVQPKAEVTANLLAIPHLTMPEDLVERRWYSAYFNSHASFEAFLRVYKKALGNPDFRDQPKALFLDDHYDTNLPPTEFENTLLVRGLGRGKHWEGIMDNSDVAGIRGDVGLTRSLTLGQRFILESPRHKPEMSEALQKRATSILTLEEAQDLSRFIFHRNDEWRSNSLDDKWTAVVSRVFTDPVYVDSFERLGRGLTRNNNIVDRLVAKIQEEETIIQSSTDSTPAMQTSANKAMITHSIAEYVPSGHQAKEFIIRIIERYCQELIRKYSDRPDLQHRVENINAEMQRLSDSGARFWYADMVTSPSYAPGSSLTEVQNSVNENLENLDKIHRSFLELNHLDQEGILSEDVVEYFISSIPSSKDWPFMIYASGMRILNRLLFHYDRSTFLFNFDSAKLRESFRQWKEEAYPLRGNYNGFIETLGSLGDPARGYSDGTVSDHRNIDFQRRLRNEFIRLGGFLPAQVVFVSQNNILLHSMMPGSSLGLMFSFPDSQGRMVNQIVVNNEMDHHLLRTMAHEYFHTKQDFEALDKLMLGPFESFYDPNFRSSVYSLEFIRSLIEGYMHYGEDEVIAKLPADLVKEGLVLQRPSDSVTDEYGTYDHEQDFVEQLISFIDQRSSTGSKEGKRVIGNFVVKGDWQSLVDHMGKGRLMNMVKFMEPFPRIYRFCKDQKEFMYELTKRLFLDQSVADQNEIEYARLNDFVMAISDAERKVYGYADGTEPSPLLWANESYVGPLSNIAQQYFLDQISKDDMNRKVMEVIMNNKSIEHVDTKPTPAMQANAAMKSSTFDYDSEFPKGGIHFTDTYRLDEAWNWVIHNPYLDASTLTDASFVDVGASTGEATVSFARKMETINPGIQIYSVDPKPYQEKASSANGLPRNIQFVRDDNELLKFSQTKHSPAKIITMFNLAFYFPGEERKLLQETGLQLEQGGFMLVGHGEADSLEFLVLKKEKGELIPVELISRNRLSQSPDQIIRQWLPYLQEGNMKQRFVRDYLDDLKLSHLTNGRLEYDLRETYLASGFNFREVSDKYIALILDPAMQAGKSNINLKKLPDLIDFLKEHFGIGSRNIKGVDLGAGTNDWFIPNITRLAQKGRLELTMFATDADNTTLPTNEQFIQTQGQKSMDFVALNAPRPSIYREMINSADQLLKTNGLLYVSSEMNEKIRQYLLSLGYYVVWISRLSNQKEVGLTRIPGVVTKGIILASRINSPAFQSLSKVGFEVSKISFELQKPFEPPPPAMQASSAMKAPGGIDMNSDNLQLSIKRDGEGIPLPASLQNWQGIHIDGLEPVIIKMEPVNLQELIGAS